MERSITINSFDGSKNKSVKYSYIDPNATDEQIYNAAVNMMSLSNNSLVDVIVTDSYTVQPTTIQSARATTTNTFRRS